MSDAQLQYVYKYKYSVKKGSGFENCGRNGLQICTSFPFKPFTCHTTNQTCIPSKPVKRYCILATPRFR